MSTVRAPRRTRASAVGAITVLSLAALTGCATGSTSATSSPTVQVSTPAATPSAGSTSVSTDALPTSQPTNGTNAILTPVQGATVAGPSVTVTGTATAFEGTLNWEVVPVGSQTPVAKGFATAGANGVVAPFSFDATIPAGTVTIAIWEPDVSNGESSVARRNLVTVTITVS